MSGDINETANRFHSPGIGMSYTAPATPPPMPYGAGPGPDSPIASHTILAAAARSREVSSMHAYGSPDSSPIRASVLNEVRQRGLSPHSAVNLTSRNPVQPFSPGALGPGAPDLSVAAASWQGSHISSDNLVASRQRDTSPIASQHLLSARTGQNPVVPPSPYSPISAEALMAARNKDSGGRIPTTLPQISAAAVVGGWGGSTELRFSGEPQQDGPRSPAGGGSPSGGRGISAGLDQELPETPLFDAEDDDLALALAMTSNLQAHGRVLDFEGYLPTGGSRREAGTETPPPPPSQQSGARPQMALGRGRAPQGQIILNEARGGGGGGGSNSRSPSKNNSNGGEAARSNADQSEKSSVRSGAVKSQAGNASQGSGGGAGDAASNLERELQHQAALHEQHAARLEALANRKPAAPPVNTRPWDSRPSAARAAAALQRQQQGATSPRSQDQAREMAWFKEMKHQELRAGIDLERFQGAVEKAMQAVLAIKKQVPTAEQIGARRQAMKNAPPPQAPRTVFNPMTRQMEQEQQQQQQPQDPVQDLEAARQQCAAIEPMLKELFQSHDKAIELRRRKQHLQKRLQNSKAILAAISEREALEHVPHMRIEELGWEGMQSVLNTMVAVLLPHLPRLEETPLECRTRAESTAIQILTAASGRGNLASPV